VANMEAENFSKIMSAVNECHSNIAGAVRALEAVASLTGKTDEINEFCSTLKRIETGLQLRPAKQSLDVKSVAGGAVKPIAAEPA
jgi:hypothetical protein